MVMCGVKSLIQSTFGAARNNFEVVVLEGSNLVHRWKDHGNPDADWQFGGVISQQASETGSIIQSNLGAARNNFEVVVLEGSNLVHYAKNNVSLDSAWERKSVITTAATGAGTIVQSAHGPNQHNFEVVVLEGPNLVHFSKDSSDPMSSWERADVVTTTATGPGCLIQSNSGLGHSAFEVVVLEGSNLVHCTKDTGVPNAHWERQIISTTATGPGSIIQSSLGPNYSALEVVVLERRALVHYWKAVSPVLSNWRRGQVITTAANGPGCMIQSTLGVTQNNFEVVVSECSQSLLHYWHNNTNPAFRWNRGKVILGEPVPAKLSETCKIAQLTGERDRQRGTLTQNKTESGPAHIRGTDLGSSFVHDGRIYFLFGDTHRTDQAPNPQHRDLRDLDAIAFTTDTDPEDGLSLTFNTLPPIVNDIGQRGFEVPVEGLSIDGKIYVYFSTDHQPENWGDTMSRTVLARSGDGGLTFGQRIYDLSRDKFINVSAQIVAPGSVPGLPQDSGELLLIWGSGRYRASDLYLAYQPLAHIEDHSTLQFFAGEGWSTAENEAVPLFSAGCIGEFSVRWNDTLRRWLLLYNSDNPRGIILRMAARPWGPWSEPRLAFDPEDGYCRFMHRPGCDALADDMFLPGVVRENEHGAEYGPYQIAPFSKQVDADQAKIYFTLSTWNPYQVILMTTVVPKID